jgi:hypothetical protein
MKDLLAPLTMSELGILNTLMRSARETCIDKADRTVQSQGMWEDMLEIRNGIYAAQARLQLA